ncbi:MAG: DUF433 domain-containing protein [Alphaproteobacteria bacterium]|nr:DUF433 domain-containing protein [Alphaproteobacteria bacterium]
MGGSVAASTFSAAEAACVTGVPPKQVHRIIDAGLLDKAEQAGKRARAVHREGLVGLKLAHETANLLTLDGRRQLVRFLLDHPDARTARARHVSVDVRPMRSDVRKGLSLLARARDAVSRDGAVLSGVPCIRGTRIPAHDIADMLANGDSARSIREAFPQISEAQIELVAFYARAYPRRGRPRREPYWRGREPIAAIEMALDELSPAR